MQANDQVLTVAQMIAAENALIDSGVSVGQLMERAGRGAAEWVWRIAAGRDVTVLCGPGNNGGDGYIIAETLRERGLAVWIIAPIEPKTDAARNAAAKWQGPTSAVYDGQGGGIFVDCLFGSGLSRNLSLEHRDLVAALAEKHSFAIAIDLPSGVESDSGALLGDIPRFELTLALGAWKYAHWRMPALQNMGARNLVPIGVGTVPNSATQIGRPQVTAPAVDAHKYTRGLLGIVGGAMPGAALLAVQAGMQAGAGYVKLFADTASPNAPASLVVDQRDLVEGLSDRRLNALLVGPGLGCDAKAAQRLTRSLDAGLPTVLDGDALSLLVKPSEPSTSPLIATPHEGELAVLCATFGVAAADKLERTRLLARRSGMTIVAKGPDTFVCCPDGRIAFSSGGSSWLSIAGSGDSLAGIIASRLAAGVEPFEAACQGVWLHSEAARLAGPAFTADTLAKSVGAAYGACL